MASTGEMARHSANAVSAAREMAATSTAQDMQQLAAGEALYEALSSMWALRAARGDDWQEILNYVQAALRLHPHESFTEAQCVAVVSILEKFLVSSVALDDAAPRKARRILRSAGLDPWAGISRDDPSDRVNDEGSGLTETEL